MTTMTTKFYVDHVGGFLGAYANGAVPPADAVEVADAPPTGLHTWDGGAWVAPAPTADDVDTERDRRLALGFDYDFGDARGVHHFSTTTEDMTGWGEVTQLADALTAVGDTTTTITIVTDTGAADVTSVEWAQIRIFAGGIRQPIWHGAIALKAMAPIPADYADNGSYWT